MVRRSLSRCLRYLLLVLAASPLAARKPTMARISMGTTISGTMMSSILVWMLTLPKNRGRCVFIGDTLSCILLLTPARQPSVYVSTSAAPSLRSQRKGDSQSHTAQIPRPCSPRRAEWDCTGRGNRPDHACTVPSDESTPAAAPGPQCVTPRRGADGV